MGTPIADTLLDEHGHPVGGASVFVYDSDVLLVATLTTDAAGAWSTSLDSGAYSVLYRKGDRHIARSIIVCGDDDGGNVREHTVLDQRMRPVAGALVWIRQSGALVAIASGNPIVTDRLGRWPVDLPIGSYDVTIAKGAASLARTLVVCDTSFFILTEAGDIIAAEDGALLRLETP